MCVLTVERSLISCIASLVIGILICVYVDCLLFDLVLSMVVQFGIIIRIRLGPLYWVDLKILLAFHLKLV